MSKNESVWSATIVDLGKCGDSQKSRAGFMNQDRLVALPPKARKAQGPWFKKMGITEEAQQMFAKMSA